MKRILIFLLFVLPTYLSFGQVSSGTYTIPGSYATIQAAITALNGGVSGSGGITFNVAAGYTESVSAQLLLTATGTSSNPIVFQKNGAGTNPKITRTDAGSNTTSSIGGLGDAVVRINSSDYITFDGIDIAASNQGIEYGYFTSKTATDGVKNITIKNCNITLNKGTSGFVIGIHIGNGTTSVSSATGVTVSSAGGQNENIVLIGNTISNVHTGIYARGSSATSYPDNNYTIGQSGAGNTINNTGGGSATSAYGIYNIYVNNSNIAYNNIDNAANGGSSHASIFYGIFTSTANANANIFNNNIIITGGGTTSAIYSIYNSYTGTISIYNNIIENGSYFSATSGALYGIYNTAAATAVNIYGNTLKNTTKAGTGAMYPIYTASTITTNIYRNNIYNWDAASGSVSGIFVNSGTTTNIYNNFVSDLKAPAATGTNAVNGLNISGGTTVNAYFNSIFLNATSSSVTTFGTSGIYASVTPTVDLRNNIVLNNSTPVGTSYSVAYRRSAAGTVPASTYSVNSNNNCFFVSSGTNQGIYIEGTTTYTNYNETFDAYKTFMATRDQGSFSEDVPFVDISSTPYDLHIQAGVTTKCESGGAVISTPNILADFDGDARFPNIGYPEDPSNPATSPDVGADEFAGIPSFTCGTPLPGNTLSSSNGLCFGQSITLTMQNATIGTGVSYKWKSSSDGINYSDISGATNQQYLTTPESSLYYKCEVTCQNGPASATSTPVQITFASNIISTTPATRCGTGTVDLSASGTGSAIKWYNAANGGTSIGTGSPFTSPVISSTTNYYAATENYMPGYAKVGTGALTSTTYTPFAGTYGGVKLQSIITANELAAAGFAAGNITSLTFHLTTAAATTYPEFYIDLGTTSLTEFATPVVVQGGLTQVYYNANVTPVVGTNSFTFDTPFYWDGVSNIILSTSWSNGGTTATASSSNYNATSNNSTQIIRIDSKTGTYMHDFIGGTQGTGSFLRYLFRPHFTLGAQLACSSPRVEVIATVTTPPALTITANQTVCNNTVATLDVTSTIGDYDTYIWSPSTNLFTDMACNNAYDGVSSETTLYAKTSSAGTTTYTCSASNVALCSNTASVNITVLPSVATINSSIDFMCQSGSADLTVTPSVGYGTATFQWQNSSDGSSYTDIPTANSLNYTTPTITSTNYYQFLVKDPSNNSCLTLQKTLVVNNQQIISTIPATRCGTGTVTLGATTSLGATIKWYSGLTDVIPLNSGLSFTTPAISATTSFYAASQVSDPGSIKIGTGALTSTTYTPFAGTYGGVKLQSIITASELNTAGFAAGNITSLTIHLTTAAATTYPDFYIDLGTTSLTEFATPVVVQGGLTQVYYNASVTPVVGTNSFTFDTPFYWDGVSNIILSTSWSNGGTTATASSSNYNATSNNSTQIIKIDSQTGTYMHDFVGGTQGSGSFTRVLFRPHFTLGAQLACLSPKVEVVATVTPPPAITPSATPNTICVGQSSNLSVSSPNDPNYTYEWIPGNLVGANQTVSPSTTTSYTVTANDATTGCSTIADISITVNPLPTINSITATPAIICEGGSSTIAAKYEQITNVANVGTQTTTIGGGDGNPYRAGNGIGNQIKTQLLYTVSELNAAGFTAGPINKIGFTTTGIGGTLANFEIRLGLTNVSALTTTYETTANTLVFTQATFTPALGINLHTFNQGSFIWDGVSNIIVQTCQTNSISGTTTVGAYAPGFASNVHSAGSSSACGNVTGTAVANKPIIRFVRDAFDNTNAYSWTWVPGNLSGSSQLVSPASTTQYTVTAQDANGCENSDNITLTVNPILPVSLSISTPLTTVNGGTNVTFTATPTNGGTIPAYQWYVNSNPVGNNSSTFTYAPANNDIITCQLTSDLVTCVTGNPAMSSAITMTVNSIGAITRTWSGTANESWTNPTNWANGIPATIDNVVIPSTATNFPTVTTPATINNLTIESGASLIDNGLILNGTATVKRLITGDKWHMLSSPVQNATSSIFVLGAGQAPIYIRQFDGTQWSYITNNTSPLIPTKGYAIWADLITTPGTPNPTINFVGALNNSLTEIPYASNWNLIGNPYTCALDWNNVTGKNFAGGAFYCWNSVEGKYSVSDGYAVTNPIPPILPQLNITAPYNIPANQGFFVNALGSGAINISGAKIHGNQAYYKSTNTLNDLIRLSAKRGLFKDEALIIFNSSATNNYDAVYDASKYFANNTDIPEVYTLAGTESIAINKFGTYPAAIPMNIRMGVSDNVTLTASEFANFDANVNITLEDMLTGTTQDLRQNPTYTFAATIGENANRFVLHFATPNGINEPNAGNISIYANNNNIYVNTTELVKEISVYNMLGQVITTISGNAKSLNTISMNNATGNYVVKVTTEKGVRTEKVFVK